MSNLYMENAIVATAIRRAILKKNMIRFILLETVEPISCSLVLLDLLLRLKTRKSYLKKASGLGGRWRSVRSRHCVEVSTED